MDKPGISPMLTENNPTTVKKRVRNYKPKVTTGCKTCKVSLDEDGKRCQPYFVLSHRIRRVKCGEEKPSCKRCTSTGRTCDGYIEQIPRNQIKKSRSPEINSCPGLTNYIPCSDIPGDAKERHSFYYFRTKTVGDISGIFASEFWNRLVLTVSHSEPTVRHALLALSSIHESYELRGRHDSLSLVQRNEFAMQQYNIALGLLASEIATKQERSMQVTLMSCLIFIFLEILRNDSGRAMKHLKSGLQILQGWHKSKRLGSDSNSKWLTQDVDPSLIILYRRMNISATIHGSQQEDFTSRYSIEEAIDPPHVQDSFSDLATAGQEMDIQLVAVLHHMRVQKEHGYANLASYRGVNEHHLHRLHLWHQAFRRFLSTSNQVNSTGVLLLKLHYTAITLLVRSLYKDTEMWYDEHNHEFEQMLHLSEAIIEKSLRPTGGLANFSTEMGIIAPLFYVGLRCRKFELRERALKLMKLSPFREGFWHAEYLHDYALWKFDREEAMRGDLPRSETLPLYARMGNEEYTDVTTEDGKTMVMMTYELGPRLPNGERPVMREWLPQEFNDFRGMI